MIPSAPDVRSLWGVGGLAAAAAVPAETTAAWRHGENLADHNGGGGLFLPPPPVEGGGWSARFSRWSVRYPDMVLIEMSKKGGRLAGDAGEGQDGCRQSVISYHPIICISIIHQSKLRRRKGGKFLCIILIRGSCTPSAAETTGRPRARSDCSLRFMLQPALMNQPANCVK